MIVLYVLLGYVLKIVVSALAVGVFLSERPYKGPVTAHFDGKVFKNPSGEAGKGFADIFKYLKELPNRDSWTADPSAFVRKDPLPAPIDSEIQLCFVGHSTFLIQHAGLSILTDPIWSRRCSPIPYSGPKRKRPPGVDFDALPQIDIVLISHNHYDHLDRATIKRIAKKWDCLFVVPLGVAQIVSRYGAKKVVEMDWWEMHEFAGMKITSIPANHFSGRGLFDRDKSLWCGYTLQTSEKSIYFLGDSGYSDIFQEIGERQGPFDLSLIPIGAFKPQSFMGPIHMTPRQAVQTHIDVKSSHSVGMHYGTFPLAIDGPDRALKDMADAKKELSVADEAFISLKEGIIKTY